MKSYGQFCSVARALDLLGERWTLLVVRELTDVRGRAGRRFLLLRRSEVSLCSANPGFSEEVCLRGERRTLIGWWRGELSFDAARHAGLELEGPRALVRAFPTWFERYLFAEVAPAHAAD